MTHTTTRATEPARPKRRYRTGEWKKRRLDYLLDSGRYDSAVREGLIDPDHHHRAINAGTLRPIR